MITTTEIHSSDESEFEAETNAPNDEIESDEETASDHVIHKMFSETISISTPTHCDQSDFTCGNGECIWVCIKIK